VISAEKQVSLLLLQISHAGPTATSVCIYRHHSAFGRR